jgi:hypothetical protein
MFNQLKPNLNVPKTPDASPGRVGRLSVAASCARQLTSSETIRSNVLLDMRMFDALPLRCAC